MTCLPDGQPLAVALLAYVAFVALAVVLPALALLRLLRLPVDAGTLGPLGLGLCAGAYGLSLVASQPWLFPGLLLALVATGFARGHGAPWTRTGPDLRGALAPILALTALFAATQYPLNRCTADGGFALDSLERVDTAFHVAVTWELTHAWPPQVPGLAGVPLDYHFGPHLVRAAAQRWAGVHPYDALARFDLTLWAVALVLAWRSAAAALGASRTVVALVPWTLLLTDLAWLLSSSARGAWLTELLGGNPLVSLFFTNALVPALALALAALAALARAQAGEGRAWLALGGLLGLALPFFKVFLAAQFLGALGLAFLLTRARREIAWVGAPCLAALFWLATGGGASNVRVVVRPFEVVQQARAALGLDAAAGLALALSALAWLALALGVRALGLADAWRGLRSPSAAAVTLAAMALVGFPLRLLGQITADGRFDEGVYFSVQSGALLWFHALTSAVGTWQRRPAGPARAALLACVALALPTGADFVIRKALAPPDPIPAAVLRATAWLATHTAPGEVVLMPSYSRHPPPPVVFIGRRVAYAEYLPYLEQFAPAEVVAARARAVRRFFKDAPGEDGARTLEGLGARWVVVFGRETEVELSARLERVEAGEGARIYRLRGTTGSGATLPLRR